MNSSLDLSRDIIPIVCNTTSSLNSLCNAYFEYEIDFEEFVSKVNSGNILLLQIAAGKFNPRLLNALAKFVFIYGVGRRTALIKPEILEAILAFLQHHLRVDNPSRLSNLTLLMTFHAQRFTRAFLGVRAKLLAFLQTFIDTLLSRTPPHEYDNYIFYCNLVSAICDNEDCVDEQKEQNEQCVGDLGAIFSLATKAVGLLTPNTPEIVELILKILKVKCPTTPMTHNEMNLYLDFINEVMKKDGVYLHLISASDISHVFPIEVLEFTEDVRRITLLIRFHFNFRLPETEDMLRLIYSENTSEEDRNLSLIHLTDVQTGRAHTEVAEQDTQYFKYLDTLNSSKAVFMRKLLI